MKFYYIMFLIWILAYILNITLKITDNKIFRNYLHIIHILLYSFIYLFSDSNDNIELSISFYIIDILYLILNEKNVFLNYAIYHHIITVIILKFYFISVVKYLMFLLELGNLSLCYIYHKIQIKKLTVIDLIIQCFIYIPIRCIITPYILYYNISNLNFIMIIFSFMLFIMNVVYSIKLILNTTKQTYKKLCDNILMVDHRN